MKKTKQTKIYLETGDRVNTKSSVVSDLVDNAIDRVKTFHPTSKKDAKEFAYDPDKVKKYEVKVTVELKAVK